jgi:hypothetical protein
MRKTFTTLLLLLAAFLGFSQVPKIEWQRTIGGKGNNNLSSIRQTRDGGYILGGYSDSGFSGDKTGNARGLNDYWVVKLDTAGKIQWQNSIGGTGDDFLNSIWQTSDGGYILGGYSSSPASGDKTENTLGMYTSTQGGIGGTARTDYWVVKLDTAGNIQWQKTIGGKGDNQLNSIQQTSDGGYILGGSSNVAQYDDKSEKTLGYYDYLVVKLDADGNIQWRKLIGETNFDYLRYIQQTSDGGYILGGYSSSYNAGKKTEFLNYELDDYWVVKLDAAGNIEWQKAIGGKFDDNLMSVQQTSDGGYILGGYSNSPISGDKTEKSFRLYDYWVVKLSASGNIEWQNTIGGGGNDNLMFAQETSDGGYILGGYSNSGISGDKTEKTYGVNDYWVVKLDHSGNIQWQKTIGGMDDDYLNSMRQTSDGGYILGGSSESYGSGNKTESAKGYLDYWVVKLK